MTQNTTPEKEAKQMADDLMKTVKGYLVNGLPTVYKSFSEYMTDFYADLPWNNTGLKIAAQHILDNHGETLDGVQKQFRFNLRKNLQKAAK